MSEKNGKKKFNVTIPGTYYKKLQLLSESIGTEAATQAAYVLQTAIDKAEEQGKIPNESISKESSEDLGRVIEYIKLLLGQRPRNGLSFAVLEDITGLGFQDLENLYQELEECRAKKPQQSNL